MQDTNFQDFGSPYCLLAIFHKLSPGWTVYSKNVGSAVFNKDGFGKSLILNEDYNLPNVSTPIIDIKSMNRSLAVLSKDHILILNAKIK